MCVCVSIIILFLGPLKCSQRQQGNMPSQLCLLNSAEKNFCGKGGGNFPFCFHLNTLFLSFYVFTDFCWKIGDFSRNKQTPVQKKIINKMQFVCCHQCPCNLVHSPAVACLQICRKQLNNFFLQVLSGPNFQLHQRSLFLFIYFLFICFVFCFFSLFFFFVFFFVHNDGEKVFQHLLPRHLAAHSPLHKKRKTPRILFLMFLFGIKFQRNDFLAS